MWWCSELGGGAQGVGGPGVCLGVGGGGVSCFAQALLPTHSDGDEKAGVWACLLPPALFPHPGHGGEQLQPSVHRGPGRARDVLGVLQ